MNIKIAKFMSSLLVVVMIIPFVLGVGGLFEYKVSAAPTINEGSPTVIYVRKQNNDDYTTLKRGDIFNIQVSFSVSDADTITGLDSLVKTGAIKYVGGNNANFTLSATSWVPESVNNSTLTVTNGDSADVYIVTLKNIRNEALSEDSNLFITIKSVANQSRGDWTIGDFKLSPSLFAKGTGGTEVTPFTPDANLENVIVMDKDGNRLDKITKDTPPFTIMVTFLEFGMEEIDFDNIPDKGLSVYFDSTSSSAFSSTKGTGGTLDQLLSSKDGVPRFKAVFNNMTYDGTDSKTFNIKPRYNIDGTIQAGAQIQVIVKELEPEKEEDDKDKVAPLKPYIIVNQYSFGDKEIIAGSDFTLSIGYTNTSSEIPLENIVMTVTTPEDLSIASSSNTLFVSSLPAKGTLSHSIDLKAKPSAKVGSAEVTIEFKYQYVDTVNKKREEGTTTEKIAVPISQIDRFEIDPITEISEMATVGEPFYVTVSFINRGKSTTYNISGNAVSKSEITSASQHYGNLEPGKANSLELAITPHAPGEMVGEVVVQYEDENTNQKELKSSFTIYVEEPYVPEPPPEDPDANIDQAEQASKKVTAIFSIVGALFIGAPIAYYSVKRVGLKESEIHDEDF